MSTKNFTLTQNEAAEIEFDLIGVSENEKLILVLGEGLIIKRSPAYFGSSAEIVIGNDIFTAKFTPEETAKLSIVGYTHRVVRFVADDPVQIFTGAVTIEEGEVAEPEYQYPVLNNNNIRGVNSGSLLPHLQLDDDNVGFNTGTGDIESNILPASSVKGKRYYVYNDGPGIVQIKKGDDVVCELAGNNRSAKITSDGTNWVVFYNLFNINQATNGGNYREVSTSDETASHGDDYIVLAETMAKFNLPQPDASFNNKRFIIKNSSGGSVDIDYNEGESTLVTLSSDEVIEVLCDGSTWRIMWSM